MSAPTLAPFDPSGWLKLDAAARDELVRPFYADYLTVRRELEAAGQYPYNASFHGRIPGIAPATSGTAPRDEETGVYLLQHLHTRTLEAVKLAEFVARGAREITPDDAPYANAADAPADYPHRKPMRGTVAVVGEYNGDSGFRVLEDVRVVRYGYRGRYLAGLPKGKRTSGSSLCLESGARVYFLPAEVTA